jgi:large subunit ribosomal protein L17
MEKLVTKAKKGRDVDRRLILKIITDGAVVNRLLMDAKDRFSQRTSGFTRMIKIGNIRSDGSEEVMLSFVDEAVKREPVTYEKPAKEEKKELKKEPKKSIEKTKTIKKKK